MATRKDVIEALEKVHRKLVYMKPNEPYSDDSAAELIPPLAKVWDEFLFQHKPEDQEFIDEASQLITHSYDFQHMKKGDGWGTTIASFWDIVDNFPEFRSKWNS